MSNEHSIDGLGQVPPDWVIAPLSDFVEYVTYGFTNPMPDSKAGPFKLTAKDVNGGRILYESARRTTWDAYNELLTKKSRPAKGDVLLTKDGSIGRVAVVDRDDVCINQSVAVMRPKEKTDARFLSYLLQTPYYQDRMAADSDGSTIKHIYITRVDKMAVAAPGLDEQRAIAAVLGALDDKMEQNRRTGRALEELARATFKAWFVDFEPVKAKASGQTSFPGMPAAAFAALPDRLTDSPLGPVPQGWEASNIGAVVQRVAMGPFGSDIKTVNFVSEGVPIIRGGNLTDGFVDRDFVFLTDAKADQLVNANAFSGDIVITHRGTLGQIGLIPTKSRYRRYVVSQSQMLIRPNEAVLPSHFLYLFLTSPTGQHELLANRSQTGVPAISRPTTSVKAIPLILPQQPVVAAFESFASTLFNARVVAEAESSMLATLRDYLLPRLLSGQVRVRQALAGVNA